MTMIDDKKIEQLKARKVTPVIHEEFLAVIERLEHERALLAEQTARAEKAEALVERAEVAFHAAIARANQALAACAEQTARAERAEQTLAEALTRLPQTWGPPDVLRHLLEKAGRCDQAEVRAEHAERESEKLTKRLEGCLERGTTEEDRAQTAEAACAELRAALENACAVFENGGGMGHEVARFRALLTRPDLGAGVVVPREVVERVRRGLADGFSLSIAGDAACEALVADLDALLKGGG